MVRWSAIALGGIAALGMDSLGKDVVTWLGFSAAGPMDFVTLGLALLLGGYVAGHLGVPTWRPLSGALAASVYILVSATAIALQEISLAGGFTLQALDLVDLVLRDLVALTTASVGAWLAGFPYPGESEQSGR